MFFREKPQGDLTRKGRDKVEEYRHFVSTKKRKNRRLEDLIWEFHEVLKNILPENILLS